MDIYKKYLKSSETFEVKSKPFETSDIEEVCRVLEVDSIYETKYKYKEVLTFSKPLIEYEKYAVCIGFNPAKAEKDLDVTNKRLINALQHTYSGYILLNIYPEITSTATEVNFDDPENQNNLKRLLNYIEVLDKEMDIIVFFGSSYSICEELYNTLLSLAHTNRLIKTTNKNKDFRHPSSIGSVDLVKVLVNDLGSNHFIK